MVVGLVGGNSFVLKKLVIRVPFSDLEFGGSFLGRPLVLGLDNLGLVVVVAVGGNKFG